MTSGVGSRSITVCIFGTYRRDYNRHQIFVKRLNSAGAGVVEIHEPLWHSIEERINAASGGWIQPRFVWRALRAGVRLLARGLASPGYDVMVVGYPGQFDVFLARLLSWMRRKPLVWDILMSTALIARERGLDKKSRITNRLLSLSESLALRLPNWLILDTPAHIAWFESTYHTPANRFWLSPLGTDDEIFQPLKKPSPQESNRFRVIYYGTFIPNHGVPYIIEAALLLKGSADISFEFIGQGPDLTVCKNLVETYNLQNVTFIDWIDKNRLIDHLAGAGVCLGAFGRTQMSLMTFHNKIYECMALKIPVITADSPAVRQMAEPGKHLLVCDRADPQTLADVICYLKENESSRKDLAENGYALYQQKYSLAIQGQRLVEFLQNITQNKGSH